MTIKYLETYTVHFVRSDTHKTAPSLEAAHKMAQDYVGNNVYVKPFAEENTFLYGPGNGDTTVMIRQDLDMDAFMGRKQDGVK